MDFAVAKAGGEPRKGEASGATMRWIPVQRQKHPVPHANPRVEQPEQPLVTELSVVVLQQEVVVPPLFEGRACCETDAGCVFYDGGAGGGKTPQTLP